MTKTQKPSRPQIAALPPGTTVLAVDQAVTEQGEIHFSSEPAFALLYRENGTSALGLLDHETPLGVHGPPGSTVAYTLVPAGTSQEELEAFVGGMYARLFGQPLPPPSPSETPQEPLTGVLSPPDAFREREAPQNGAEGEQERVAGDPETVWTVVDTPQ